jgi:hypothetical protein
MYIPSVYAGKLKRINGLISQTTEMLVEGGKRRQEHDLIMLPELQ